MSLLTACSLVLASNSPRRKELLSLMGVSYDVDVPDVDENIDAPPAEAVETLAKRKAIAVANRHAQAVILAADTLVYQECILGKPQNEEEAADMLRRLSGKWHEVYTGVCVLKTDTQQIQTHVECTRVHFCQMSKAEIDAYVKTGEPMDKAGAYGVQGMAGMYIDRIDGSYSSVVGLPLHSVRKMLQNAGMALPAQN